LPRPRAAVSIPLMLVVEVPLNTAISDLDEALRGLLLRELGRHGFKAEIAFDAPSKEWSGKMTGPTVNLFLYDLREATERAEATPTERRHNGQAVTVPPALRLELTYAVSAWAPAVEDEHKLLTQVLAILFSHRQLPVDLIERSNGGVVALRAAQTSVGRPREEKADFWTSVGGEYKASFDFVVHLSIESGATFVRGPEVRTQTMRLRDTAAPPGALEEMHRIGGTVCDAGGEPAARAWVVLPAAGLWTATDAEGRFRINRVRAGEQELVVRAVSGAEATLQVDVPGAQIDVVLDAPRAGR
jgi:hypothetical protein